MERADKDLAFLLRYENVAWFEDGEVRILDRRIYPAKVEFVTCRTHQEVARAITDMVTQSAGPYTAAPMGMALAAWECRGKSADEQMEYLKKAAYTISHARPTTQKRMTLLCDICLKEAERALSAGENVAEAIKNKTIELNNVRYNRMAKIGSYLVDMFPDNGTVMTHCFAETIVGTMLRECRSRGKNIRLFCPETRPYFHGARLTASVCHDMGFDVTVISDNMPAFVMQNEKVDVFTTAADAICCDGHVVNKVGTFQNAIVAKYMGIPYFVTGAPDQGHETVDSIHIEMRDPNFTLQAMGVRTAMEGVKGSGRSIEEYSMYEELCKCRELLEKFGGHPMAAGLSLPEENVDKFREKINACANLTEDDLIPKIKIDIPMPAAYADAGLIREFAVLEPFGKANIKPQFADKNLSITKAFVVGKNQNVLRLNLLTAAGEAVSAVYFGDIEAFKAYYAEKYGSAEVEKAFRGQINKLRIMIVYYPEINEYNGVESVQVIIRNYQ